MTLTAEQVKNAGPKAGLYELPDEKGLSLRVLPSGTKSWRVLWWESGRAHRKTIGRWPTMTLQKAREERDRIRGEHAGADVVTLEGFVETYMRYWARPRKKDNGEFDEYLLHKYILPCQVQPDPKSKRRVRLGDRAVIRITRSECVQVTAPLVERGCKDTAHRVHSCLRRVLQFAVEREIRDGNPAARIPIPKGKSRDRALDTEDLVDWWPLVTKLVPEEPRRALELVLATGQRLGEVLAMDRRQIDRVERTWLIPAEVAKNGHETLVPLSDWSWRLVGEALDVSSRKPCPAFRISGDTVRQWMKDTVERAGIERATPHDLRRTVATWLGRLECEEKVIKLVLNHIDDSVTNRYNRYQYLNEKREVLQLWADRFWSIVSHAHDMPTTGPDNAL